LLFAANENRLAGLQTGDGNVKKQQRFPKIRPGVPSILTGNHRCVRCAALRLGSGVTVQARPLETKSAKQHIFKSR